jgi:murein DD-endopeptidase MepM/ murein hydrolase activator NlpD
VLSTEFYNNGKSHQAMWFQEAGKKGAYYTLDGKSLRQAYLNYPVEFSRISSGFSMRVHPIQKTWRAHLGTDFAAPGTKVRTVGDGVVSFAGVQNGYGNVIFVDHANQHTTVYAHLSRIDVKRGQRVDQGDIIGAVGSTGWATGPHLHFEFRDKGEQRDPLTIAQITDSASPSPRPPARPSSSRQRRCASNSRRHTVVRRGQRTLIPIAHNLKGCKLQPFFMASASHRRQRLSASPNATAKIVHATLRCCHAQCH